MLPRSSALRRAVPQVSRQRQSRGIQSIASPISSTIRPLPTLPPSRPLPRLTVPNPPHQCHQQQRTIFEDFKRRIQYERETGNLANLRLPIIAAILTASVGLILVVYGYTTYQAWAAKTFHTFPASVAKELRRALYYAQDPNTYRDAIRHYVAALEKAREEGLHPLSREVTGIKIEVARICEEAGRKDKAVDVLRDVWTGLSQGVELWDKNQGKEGPERTALVKRTVETAVRLGGLLIEMEGRGKEGQQVLEKAVETVIAEEKRREGRFAKKAAATPAATVIASAALVPTDTPIPAPEKVDQSDVEDDGWLTPLEIASTFEILATYYLTTSRPQLSTPLLLHALSYLDPKSCHAATIMSTISTSFASTHSESATAWAEKAIDIVHNGVPPKERTDDCDEACVVAMCNLAELRWRDSDRVGARKWFDQAGTIAKAMNWSEGLQKVEDGIKLLDQEQADRKAT